DPDIAGQGKKCERLFVIDVLGLPPLGQAGTFGILAFAALHIGPDSSATYADLLAGIRIRPEDCGPVGATARLFIRFGAQLPRVTAFRIIRATHKCAVSADLQGEPA